MTSELAKLVRVRRQALGWTQTDLARALGSSPSRICKLEAADVTVSPSLMLRALEVMATPIRIEIDASRDPFRQPGLSKQQRRQMSERLLRRKHAEQLAERHDVDAGDLEHVFFNLTLSPWHRLARSFQRAGLRRLSAERR